MIHFVLMLITTAIISVIKDGVISDGGPSS